jgi:hypothetical protein
VVNITSSKKNSEKKELIPSFRWRYSSLPLSSYLPNYQKFLKSIPVIKEKEV